jgi:hypothetical protein
MEEVLGKMLRSSQAVLSRETEETLNFGDAQESLGVNRTLHTTGTAHTGTAVSWPYERTLVALHTFAPMHHRS